MRKVAAEAVTYGQQILPDGQKNRRVVVILNPNAKKKSSQKLFDTYCGPILYLAGIQVDIIKTESEGFARSYIETELTELPDALVVAGGDGTLLEVVTGLMRRDAASCPIGVLPLGRNNMFSSKLLAFSNRGRLEEVQALTSATMSVIRNQIETFDVLKVDIIEQHDTETTSNPKKSIYAMSVIQMGAFRDAMSVRDKYWYFFSWRENASLFFNAFKTKTVNWFLSGTYTTTAPCSGCSNCYEVPNSNSTKNRWWSVIVPKKIEPKNVVQIRSRLNPECGVPQNSSFDNKNEMLLATRSMKRQTNEAPGIMVRWGSSNVKKIDWIRDSWKRLDDITESAVLSDPTYCRTLQLIPDEEPKETFISIDNEEFELKPIRVQLIPNRVSIFKNNSS